MKKGICGLVCIILSVLMLTGCVTSIQSIREDPQKYGGKSVLLEGEVLMVVNIPLVDVSLFLFGSEEEKVPVVSSQKHKKGEYYRMTARVLAFPEAESKEASETAVQEIASFLVEYGIAGEDKAQRAAVSVLSGLYRLSEGLGQIFFLMEGDDLSS